MKKFLILLIIIGSLFLVQTSFAQVSSQSATIDYTLPYPGILPDNPLYFFKVLRDRIVSFLISDPSKKAEFDLLSADKRLSGSIALFDKGEKDLAEQTVSKGENYFEDGIKKLKISEREGTPIDPNLLTNMELSSKKHKEILTGFVESTNGKLKDRFQNDLKRASQFVTEVLQFKSK